MFAEMMITIPNFIMLLGACFLAGFVDAIAGGGGLISLPAYVLAGVPIHMAYGCNKFSAACGTTIAAARYWKHKMLDIPVGLFAALGAFLASWAAAELVLEIRGETLQALVLVFLPIAAVITLVNKKMGDVDASHTNGTWKKAILGTVIGVIIGFYDGLIGPGTGTFALMAFCLIMKYDMRTASGNAKCLNLASNYAALVVFLLAGTVYLPIAIPAGICGVAGSFLGSGLAIKKGTKVIRLVMVLVIMGLFLKMGADLLV